MQREYHRTGVRLEAVGRLAGGVAHDFNNLLTIIMGRCEVMMGRLQSDDPLARDVMLIHDVTQKAATLTRQLLAFGRNQVLEPKVVDVNTLVFGMQTMLTSLISENIHFQVNLEPALSPVLIDQPQLERVIVNLIVNAVDAMSNGGALTIETRNVQLFPNNDLFDFPVRPGPYILLSVKDTGSGMDAETLSHAFEPFFTTKQEKGTGLGLSTVYGIVKQSNGYVAAVSAPGKGTTLEIYLPAMESEADRESRKSINASGADGVETILVVEDAPLVRKLTRELLEAGGYSVLEATNAETALQICKSHDGAVHLMLTDVIMPGMSGGELGLQAVSERPKMKVLLMSGYAEELARGFGSNKGFAFLSKPFTADALRRKVREALDS